MEELKHGEGDWVWVRRPNEIDVWSPSGEPSEPEDALKIRFSAPAKHWTDAVPIGNGRLGAMVWGGVLSEKLQLNGMRLKPPITSLTFTSPKISATLLNLDAPSRGFKGF